MKLILDLGDANVRLLNRMLADIDSADMCRQPPGVRNHAAWQVGHLSTVRAALAGLLGANAGVPESWNALFMRGSEPSPDAARYPSKAELLETFGRAHEACKAAAAAAPEEALDRPNPIEGLKWLFPTTRLLVAGLFTTHDALHLGQLSVWRRTQGLPQVI